jgi:hypothetical protein
LEVVAEVVELGRKDFCGDAEELGDDRHLGSALVLSRSLLPNRWYAERGYEGGVPRVEFGVLGGVVGACGVGAERGGDAAVDVSGLLYGGSRLFCLALASEGDYLERA